ncbi:hypothetical protein [Pedobacter sp. ASV28]|uniref:beta strand repeat-containing protein n=1 Tax=Pedobacter sp. ASV28 TaxID=2795123 RepID=UPI0018EB79F8|nr:hypothetical protein [Pedobacter sp. ASV28]
MSKLLRYVLLLPLCLGFYINAQGQNCTVNAGIATTVCPGSPFVLNGQASGLFASGGTAVWSQVSGPSVTISPSTISGTAVTATVSGFTADVNYVFRLTAKCTDGSLVYQDVTYVVSSLGTVNAGPDNYACPGTYVLQGSPLGSGETGIWTKISGTGPDPNAATINNPNATITFTSNASAQSATYRWTVSKTTGGNTCSSYDDVVITNLGTQAVNAGVDISRSCYNVTTSAQLNGSFAGANTNYGQSGQWTFVSGPSNPTISNAAVYNPTVSNLEEGTYIFRYTVTGPCYSGSDDVAVIVAAASQSLTAPGNSTQTFCDGRTSVVLTGPKALYANEVVLWEKVSGPGTQTFSTTNSNSTTVSGLSGAPGANYVFRYTISNSVTNCTNNGTYNVQFRGAPAITITTPNTNPYFLACNATSLAVSYTISNGTATQYALISAPAGSTRETTMGGLNNWTTAPASGTTLTGFDKIGTYVLRYRRNTDNGLGGCTDAYAEITVVVSASPTPSNGGTKQVLACNVFNTNLAGNLPTSGIGKWSQVSGPNTANIVNPLSNTTAVTGMVNGTYSFRWIVSGGEGACTNTQADVEVVVAAPVPTTSAAGLPQTVCNSTPVLLDGNEPIINEVGTWTVVRTVGNAAAPEVIFSPNANSPKAIVSGLLASTSYTFKWSINNACGSSSSDVVIETSGTAGAKQATAAISTGTICLPSGTGTLTMAGNQPTNGEVGTWSLISGPNTPNITNTSLYNTTLTGLIDGNYEFQWQLSRNGCTPTASRIKITISAPATTANAGSDQNICGTTVTLNGNQPSTGTGTWTQIAGPGGAVITNASLRNTTVTGLNEGRYIFRWTISNGTCTSSTAEVTINVSQPPSTAAAGVDFEVCNLTATALNATPVTLGTGYWSVVSGPNIPTFSSINSANATVSGLIFGQYTFRWTVRGGIYCTPSTDDVVVRVTSNANAGADQNLCALTSTTLTGTNQSTGTWTQTGGPNTATITTISANTAIASNLTPGSSYQFTYTIAATGSCPQSSDDMMVNISALPSAADAGLDQNYCSLTAAPITSVTLAAVAPVSGTGSWNVIEKPTGSPTPTFSPANSATATFGNLRAGTYMLEWIVTSGSCTGANSNRDIVKINIYTEPTTANAGPDQNAACTSNVILTGNTPAAGAGVGTWSIVSEPVGSNATFSAINSPTTVVNNTITGTYVFRWTISNGSPTCTSKTDDVTVKVTSVPTTVASVGTNQQVCNTGFPGTPTISTTLTGNTPSGMETGTWTFVSGPTTLTAANFNDIHSPVATITGLAQGTYVLRWTIVPTSNQTSADCQSSADLTITVANQPTTAIAGVNQVICLSDPVTLAANTITSGIGTWSVVSKPIGAVDPVFANPNSPTSAVNGFVAGNYTLRWTSSNGTCTNSTSDMTITVKSCDIAISKATSTPVLQSDGSYNITLTFNVLNNGDQALSNVQVEDDLTLTFPSPKTYTVTSITSGSGTLTVNSAFNGNSNKNLLNAAASTLAAGSQQTITLVLNVKLI